MCLSCKYLHKPLHANMYVNASLINEIKQKFMHNHFDIFVIVRDLGNKVCLCKSWLFKNQITAYRENLWTTLVFHKHWFLQSRLPVLPALCEGERYGVFSPCIAAQLGISECTYLHVYNGNYINSMLIYMYIPISYIWLVEDSIMYKMLIGEC